MGNAEQSERSLIDRMRSGDPDAFGSLYELYRPRLYRYLRRMLDDHDLAEDMIQETFLKAKGSIGTLLSDHSAFAWFLAIARNMAFGHLRSLKSSEPLDESIPWEGASPFDDIVMQERTTFVRTAIGRLKPLYRDIILLREYEMLTYAEIATALGESESTVKARLFKARKALLEALSTAT